MVRDLGGLKQQALRLGIPAVVLGHRDREIRGLINVGTDSSTVGLMAAEHLLQCGFKHFAYCGLARSSMEQISWSMHRFDSFSNRIAKAGFKLPPPFVISSSAASLKKNRRELADWLLQLPHPIGVMACNDDCGAQLAEACKLAGLSVPDAVGIVGVDNDEVVCGLADPPMTSVAINFERAGYQAAEALNRLMLKSKKKPDHNISALATHVVVRRSTGIVAMDDEHLGKAMACIRDRAGTPLSVSEVAKAAGISRRTLERSFRQQMGVSILKEIRRQRTDRIARLLLETNLPVARIADSLGFSDVQHFARYFRSGKQMSPMAFRKRHVSQSLS
jgi:LacI family transcriptional regulator